MKLLFAGLLLMATQCAVAQIRVSKLDTAAIPKFIKYKGEAVGALRYTDKERDHVVVTSYDIDQKTNESDDNLTSVFLYAYNYKVVGKSATLVWQLYDFVKDCDFDFTGDFLPNTLAVTDLDKNGLGEVWLMYRTACRSDVSPSTLKIIMRQGGKKYAVRGTCRVKVNGTDYIGGTYAFDEAFNAAPETFKAYARQLWKKNVNETDFGL